jgi:transcription antitermination factor NusG
MAEAGPDQPLHWYALTVKSQHEKAVADQLRAKSLESYLPLYRARRRWSDRTKTIELPLFSRYVFCRFNFEARLKVLQVSSVLSVVGFGGKPCPIPDHDIHTIQAVVGSGLPVSPWPFLRIGQRVRVTEGALAGLEGILARKKSGYRVIVNMEMLNRAIAVEIEQDLVLPVAAAPTAPSSELHLSW